MASRLGPEHFVAVALAVLASGGIGSAVAQEPAQTAQVGRATLTFGGGVATLTLPDVAAVVTRSNAGGTRQLLGRFIFSDDFGHEFGWNVNGALSVPFDGPGGKPMAVGLSGFWARIEGDDSFVCSGSGEPGVDCLVMPLVDNAVVQQFGGTLGAETIAGQTNRKVDQWGVALEAKLYRDLDSSVFHDAFVAVGADMRGIYQDLNSQMVASTGARISYTESLDTTYYGGFAAIGATYVPPLFGGLWDRLGLESSFRLQGGVYYANTQYDGTLAHTAPFPVGGGNPSGGLSLTRDDTAFIGGISLQTAKRIGARAKLSLKSDIEYYSFVPSVAFNERDRGPITIAGSERRAGTSIDRDDAWSFRTMLNLSIALGN